jgi:hypothetical protein
VRKLGAEPVIPYPPQIKDPMIEVGLTKRFKVRGDPRLLGLYRLRMSVERSFRVGKLELMMANLRWMGAAKVRLHVAMCFVCMYSAAIFANRIGRPEPANSIEAFTY